ncbi:class I SAM-dependent methyltransferase [Nitrospina watsonii]|uniref:Class I SAM-dependent methyltransferase n=1 Tax=Nitrospina watsonii TaxID=1323948 RepID=A0ABM9HA93_9BACT|nr:class I SAM-dependent methyltransferase [Nitrospina watsonii]CAI2717068.1 Class I SAM-dependent methyltransferase [Nitrospina watsonii]
MYSEIKECRIGGGQNLVSVLNLGQQVLTGVFPRTSSEHVTAGPLELVWCPESGLLQLKHSYEPGEMYGDNYGYRSGLNQSMVDHLTNKVRYLERTACLKSGDIVVDIGSNDATTLKAYQTTGIQKLGIDPTGEKFKEFYTDDIKLIADFFSEEAYRSAFKEPAKIITSIAMFYDLEDPIGFARQVESILDDDGIWHFEQSYMPSMLRLNSYDTICHEHLEYYSLGVVEKILRESGLKLIDVVMNSINGGSFAVSAVKVGNKTMKPNSPVIDWLLEQEGRMGLTTPKPFRDFEERVYRHRNDLTRLIHSLAGDGKTILGYGASTKGNVVLQFCGFTEKEIPAIAEVNTEKFGRFTPGTNIPIISEKDAAAMKPDYYLVLPWHFKEGIVRREKDYLSEGGRMIFPFPEIEIV